MPNANKIEVGDRIVNSTVGTTLFVHRIDTINQCYIDRHHRAVSFKNAQLSAKASELEPEEKLIISCYDCGEEYTLKQINEDNVRVFQDGEMIRFGSLVTQKQLDSLAVLCECCEEEKYEKDY